ncbi:MAG TPA: AAA family ATPase, partial [Solirubrobacteraceae bacterium]
MQLRGQAASVGTAELLERTEELSLLREQIGEVNEHSSGRLVLVAGEAGIGKTALLRSFCDDLDECSRVLWASCDPLFTPRPLGPLLDVARETDGELRAQVEAGGKPHDVAAALLRELDSARPTVLVLEDLHWADEATLDVVRLVWRRVKTVRALLIGSYRSEQLHRLHPLRSVLGELPRSSGASRLELLGLSPEAVRSLAEGSSLDADELYARTAGNPFFVTEALAADTELVPETVRDAVLARVARLGAAARGLLDAVAVVPQRAEVWLLEALAPIALEALDECVSSGILRTEADGVAFRHELARLVVEESLPLDRAIALHRRALDALAEPAIGEPDLARLAHHAEAARDAAAVLRFAPAAAKQAEALGSPREAKDQYARALRFAQGVGWQTRTELLEGFAQQCYLTDMRDEAITALDEALAIHGSRGDVARQGELLRFRSATLGCMGRFEEARSSVRKARDVLEHGGTGCELQHARAAQLLAALEDDIPGIIRWNSRVIELAEEANDSEALATALNNLGFAELMRGHEPGREKLER